MPVTPVAPSFVVNTFPHYDQDQPELTALASGGFVAVYHSQESPGLTYESVRARVFTADGTPLGDDFLVPSDLNDHSGEPAVTALPNGNFVVAWNYDTGAGNGSIRARVFNSAGTAVTGEIDVRPAGGVKLINPSINALSDGRFVVTWTAGGPNAAEVDTAMGRIYGADGTALTGEFQINASAEATYWDSTTIVGLSHGGFVVTFNSANGPRARVFDGNGTPIGSDFAVIGTWDVTALANGRFMVIGANQVQVYDSNGAALGAALQVPSGEIATLTDGRVAMAYARDVGGQYHIYVLVLNADGSISAPEIDISSSDINSAYPEHSITALSNGRFVVSWAVDPANNGNTDLRAQIFDPGPPPGAATQGPDVWQGTNAADSFSALGGDDILYGNGGGDLLRGDAGNDTIYGGAGNDTLSGGDGNDTLLGGSGADYLTGGSGADRASYIDATAGVRVSLSDVTRNRGDARGDTYNSIENLTGSNFDDVLFGSAGANRISGSSGHDTVYGYAGNDTLFGNDGNDLLNAGDGNDILSGGDGNDTLIGGSGSDYLSGGVGADRASYIKSAGAVRVNLADTSQNTGDARGDRYNSIENLTGSNYGDSLTGSHGANRISGGDGNDTINGLKGNDVIFGGSGNDRIYGHLGSDTLEGNAGNDTFIFHQALGATNIDTITDFNRAADTIELWNDVFTRLGSGTLSSSAFKDMAVSAKDANDRIIYNSDTGILYYDADGSGTAYGNVKFAVLSGKPTIGYNDFVVV